MKQPPENRIAGLGENCKLPQWHPGQSHGHKRILTSKIAPGGNSLVIYLSLQRCTLRIKQLYGQEVPEQCFGIQKK